MAINQLNTPADLVEMLSRAGQGDRKAFERLYQATSAKF